MLGLLKATVYNYKCPILTHLTVESISDCKEEEEYHQRVKETLLTETKPTKSYEKT